MDPNKQDLSIPLVVAFTPNYFIPVATCLYSLFENTDDKNLFHVICLLSEELSIELKEKIQLIGAEKATYSFINLQGKLKDIYVDAKYTEAASYRLLLPDLLPEYDKVLYIDCDVIVRNDLGYLYHSVDLKDNYLAAVFEAPMDFQQDHLKAIGVDSGSYINSGFLMMNLKQLREDNMVEKFIEASKAEYLEFPDQDVLNQLCRGRILGLPPYYNSIRTFYLPQYKYYFLEKYTEKDWEEVWSHGTIHYTGTKPWNDFTIEFKTWWQYYDQLPATIKKEWQVNRKLYSLYKVYDSAIGSFFIDGIRSLYRKWKYNKSNELWY